MVTAEEVTQVKSLAAEAKSGDGFDFGQLSAESLNRLNALYTSINNKVGYSLPSSSSKPIAAVNDAAASGYVEAVNSQLAATAKQLDNARLTSFVKAFM